MTLWPKSELQVYIILFIVALGILSALFFLTPTRKCVNIITLGQSQLYCTGNLTLSQWPIIVMQAPPAAPTVPPAVEPPRAK